MEIFGYFASVLIGISLGLIGGGGSILTVPVLVYLFGVDAVTATAYSLFIVGTTSAVGSYTYFKNDLINLKTAIVFGIPSILAVFVTRKYIIPSIPDEIFTLDTFIFTKSMMMMLLFAVLMMVAAVSMIRKPSQITSQVTMQVFNYPLILAEGLLVGILTGLVGAGGGFLIIPALVILSKIPMKKAIGTSLVIIAAKSLIGFLGEKDLIGFDWHLLSSITFFALIGIYIGSLFAEKISGEKLKPAFGWFVFVMGIYIFLKESILK